MFSYIIGGLISAAGLLIHHAITNQDHQFLWAGVLLFGFAVILIAARMID